MSTFHQAPNAFPTLAMPGIPPSDCPARWVWLPGARHNRDAVLAFRLCLTLAEPTVLRLHVSADQRYELFCDGKRMGRGPHRGDLGHWFYETYDLDLAAGSHLLAARVWWFGGSGSPMAQMTGEPGFLVLAEGSLAQQVSTGSGRWEVTTLDTYEAEASNVRGYHVVGRAFVVAGARIPWGWNTDLDCSGPWVPAVGDRMPIGGETNPGYGADAQERRVEQHLVPAMLPPMIEVSRYLGTVRHAEWGGDARESSGLVEPHRHDAALAAHWQALLAGEQRVTLNPGTRVRLIVDLEDYYCAYPELMTSGGAGGQVTIAWAESLFDTPDSDNNIKGDRNAVANKYYRGMRDRFLLEGGADRVYDTLWWRSGRYVEICVAAVGEALTVERLLWRETRYPIEREGHFEASDPRLGAAIPMMYRTLQMCAHETFMDCPYYEQLMYVGDTRLEALVTHLTSHDGRLPALACALFDWSRAADGLTKSRYPSAVPQVIPPFSLWWVAMVHDYWMWRDAGAAQAWLPGVDAVLTGIGRYLCNDLLTAIRGWNFCDWVPEWNAGWPPASRYGANALINLQYVYSLDRAAEMHEFVGEGHLAAHWREVADRVRAAIVATYWDEARGLLADDPAHAHYSEHVQALALLTGLLDGPRRERMIAGLLSAPDLARTTVYFSHYLFEALGAIGNIPALLERLSFWNELASKGFVTTLEAPEPSRSDCHAWGAHPIYHYYATLLGARPASPGFESIRISPQPGPLTRLAGGFPHSSGEMVSFDLQFHGDVVHGEIVLPAQLGGTLVWQGNTTPLVPGRNVLT